MSLVWTVLLLFVAAAVAPAIVRLNPRAAGRILALLPAGIFVSLLARMPDARDHGVVERITWVPSLNIEFALHLDGLSLLFALLICGFGAVVTLYAGRYLAGNPHLGRFYLAFLLFMGAMLGLVVADDLIVLFVFWELTSISSFLLIGFDHEREASRKAALQALLVTGGGGLALLAGLLLLAGASGGTFSLSEIVALNGVVREHGAYPAILALVLLGAFTKSAQFPFHFWLPNAMAAPTPVSAYLHSATMVKAGIYLLARLDSTLGDTIAWSWSLSLAGGATMLLGAVVALRQTDLKRILAYSTLTALGTLTLLLGLSFEDSIKAAVVFLIVHSLYKGALFLAAGNVDHEAGSRDVLTLGGLRRALPLTAAAAVVAGLSMAGLPPLFGFIAKELTYKAKLGFEASSYLLPAVAVLVNAFTFAAAAVIVLRTFFGRTGKTPRTPHEAPLEMWLGTVLLAGAGLMFGVLPAIVSDTIVGPAVFAVLGRPMTIKLTLWYGPNLALLLSVLTVVLGLVTYLRWDSVRLTLSRLDGIHRFGAEAAYDRLMGRLVRTAAGVTRLLQTGDLRHYLIWAVGLLLALGAAALVRAGGIHLAVPAADYVEWALALATVGGAVGTALVRSRVAALLSLAVAGTGVALFFVVLGAPDLALTQFLIETLTLLLAVAVLTRLRTASQRGGESGRRLVHGTVAIMAGVLMTLLTLAVTSGPFESVVADFYARASVPSAFGRNIVNVILVDFRAMDTLGEITVLAVAAIGAIALLRFPLEQLPDREPYDSLVLRMTSRIVVPLLLLLAGFLLLRGHNAPGGGFIAGLLASGAVVLHVLVQGTASARRIVRVSPEWLLAAGLAIAVLSGLVAAFAGSPFLTGLWVSIDLPAGLAPLKLGTPLLFDTGVFLVVVGFVLSIFLVTERA